MYLYVFIAYKAKLFHGSVLHFVLHFVGDFEVHCKAKLLKSIVYKLNATFKSIMTYAIIMCVVLSIYSSFLSFFFSSFSPPLSFNKITAPGYHISMRLFKEN